MVPTTMYFFRCFGGSAPAGATPCPCSASAMKSPPIQKDTERIKWLGILFPCSAILWDYFAIFLTTSCVMSVPP